MNGCDAGVTTVHTSDVAHSGPRDAQGVCVFAHTQEKLQGTLFGTQAVPSFTHYLPSLRKKKPVHTAQMRLRYTGNVWLHCTSLGKRFCGLPSKPVGLPFFLQLHSLWRFAFARLYLRLRLIGSTVELKNIEDHHHHHQKCQSFPIQKRKRIPVEGAAGGGGRGCGGACDVDDCCLVFFMLIVVHSVIKRSFTLAATLIGESKSFELQSHKCSNSQ